MAQAMTKEMGDYLGSDVIYSDYPVIDAILDVLRDMPETTLVYRSTDPVSVKSLWIGTINAIKAGK